MTDLARDERVVRRYSCTAVDRVALIAGTVIPLPGSVESEGILTLTNRRVIFELDADGKAGTRQEARLSGVSSISSMMSKFGRDLRLPILMIVLGFLLMFAPYVYYSETGALAVDGDYEDGYNDGVEYGYFTEYLGAVQSGQVSHGIPDGYYYTGQSGIVSAEYKSGNDAGQALGKARAQADIAADAPFSIPDDLKIHSSATSVCLILAVIGAVVFVMGSVLYVVSNTTKDWISVNLGSGGRGIAVKSFDGGWRATGYRALTAENQYWDMTRELGAAILEIKNYREHRVRFVEEDVVIEEADGSGDDPEETPEAPSEREMLPPMPEDEEFSSGMLVIDDDDSDSRIVTPDWRD